MPDINKISDYFETSQNVASSENVRTEFQAATADLRFAGEPRPRQPAIAVSMHAVQAIVEGLPEGQTPEAQGLTNAQLGAEIQRPRAPFLGQSTNTQGSRSNPGAERGSR